MISTKVFTNVSGTSTRFLSDFIIQSEAHCRVYVATSLTVAPSDLVTADKYDLVDNAILFYTAPIAGSNVFIEVATTPEEFGEVLLPPIYIQTQEVYNNTVEVFNNTVTTYNNTNIVLGETVVARDIAIAQAVTATTKASEASVSASSALTSANNAATSEDNASISETNALSSATSASISATNASTSATSASNSATNSSNSATIATTQAGIATNKADIATTQAGIATTKANEASASAIDAANSAVIAQNATALKVDKTSDTGSAKLPTGTTAQRDSTPTAGYIRYNTDLSKAEIYTGSTWSGVGGGATGGGSDTVFVQNSYTINNDYTIPSGQSAVTVGDASGNVSIASGATVSISDNSRWVVL